MTKRDKDKKRQRPIILQTRVSEDEAALVRSQARKHSVSVSALMRYAVLDLPPLPVSRQPKVNEQEIARLVAALGSVAQALRDTSETRGASKEISAIQRDVADIHYAAFKALGREP